MSPITTHILDTSRGHPAANVTVTLSRVENGCRLMLAKDSTNADGRIANWLVDKVLERGEYEVHFDTAGYFAAIGCRKYFYPEVTIRFLVEDPQAHYHVPLLISPFGFSTYRGS